MNEKESGTPPLRTRQHEKKKLTLGAGTLPKLQVWYSCTGRTPPSLHNRRKLLELKPAAQASRLLPSDLFLTSTRNMNTSVWAGSKLNEHDVYLTNLYSQKLSCVSRMPHLLHLRPSNGMLLGIQRRVLRSVQPNSGQLRLSIWKMVRYIFKWPNRVH